MILSKDGFRSVHPLAEPTGLQAHMKRVHGVIIPWDLENYYDNNETVWSRDCSGSKQVTVCKAKDVPVTYAFSEFLGLTDQAKYRFKTKQACILNFVDTKGYATTQELLDFIHLLSSNGRYNRATRGYYCTWLYNYALGTGFYGRKAREAVLMKQPITDINGKKTSVWSLTHAGAKNLAKNRSNRGDEDVQALVDNHEFPEFKYHGKDDKVQDVPPADFTCIRTEDMEKIQDDNTRLKDKNVVLIDELRRIKTAYNEDFTESSNKIINLETENGKLLKEIKRLEDQLADAHHEKNMWEEKADELDEQIGKMSFELSNARESKRVLKAWLS
jgi:hypothetical protein